MKLKSLIVVIIVSIFLCRDSFGQSDTLQVSDILSAGSVSDDTIRATPKKTESKKSAFGGIFLSPMIGGSIPFGQFGDFSNAGFTYGFKLEVGYNKIYPFILGFIYENQSNPGNPEYTTSNFLTQFDTEIIYYGGSVDINLNKYLKSNFTSPIIGLEVKLANLKRTISPDTSVPDVPREESILSYAMGLYFTLYIFDVGAKYTYAGDYSSLNVSARIHIPLIRF